MSSTEERECSTGAKRAGVKRAGAPLALAEAEEDRHLGSLHLGVLARVDGDTSVGQQI
jgi:hypothetical protein